MSVYEGIHWRACVRACVCVCVSNCLFFFERRLVADGRLLFDGVWSLCVIYVCVCVCVCAS